MHEKGKKLLTLMFNEGETICVSPNEYGYHSVPLNHAFDEEVTMVSPNANRAIEYCKSNEIKLVALNPIHGFRRDSNCYKFRNFLIELDTGHIEDQIQYIKSQNVPYSALVFSGNKSVHALVSLDTDLPSEKIYRMFAEWILNILPLADENIKNPSRSIRVPGAMRDGKMQDLLEYKGKVSAKDFTAWLAEHPEARPKERVKREAADHDGANLTRVEGWVKHQLLNGIDFSKGRNKTWFSIACSFALAGYSQDEAIDILSDFFNEDDDFREKEWLTSIDSAFNYIHAR